MNGNQWPVLRHAENSLFLGGLSSIGLRWARPGADDNAESVSLATPVGYARAMAPIAENPETLIPMGIHRPILGSNRLAVAMSLAPAAVFPTACSALPL